MKEGRGNVNYTHLNNNLHTPYPPKNHISTMTKVYMAGTDSTTIPKHMATNLNLHPPHHPIGYTQPTYTPRPSIPYPFSEPPANLNPLLTCHLLQLKTYRKKPKKKK